MNAKQWKTALRMSKIVLGKKAKNPMMRHIAVGSEKIEVSCSDVQLRVGTGNTIAVVECERMMKSWSKTLESVVVTEQNVIMAGEGSVSATIPISGKRSDYPILTDPGLTPPTVFTVYFEHLTEAIRLVENCVDENNSRDHLRNILLTEEGDVVATDGRRMHIVNVPVNGYPIGNIMLPVKVCDILKLVDGLNFFWTVATTEDGNVRAVCSSIGDVPVVLTWKECDGSYPQNVIPCAMDEDTVITLLPYRDLIKICEAASTEDKANNGILLEIEDGKITVSCEASKWEVICKANKKFGVRMDPTYVADALKLMEDGSLIRVSNIWNPVVFGREGRMAIVMPKKP